MTRSPQGLGIAQRINENAVPALLRKKNVAGTSSSWRRTHAPVEVEDIDIYLILKDEEMTFGEVGEENKQWAVLYNTKKKLLTGQAVEFPDQLDETGKPWQFVIRKTTQRPAINPNYYKAFGVKQD